MIAVETSRTLAANKLAAGFAEKVHFWLLLSLLFFSMGLVHCFPSKKYI